MWSQRAHNYWACVLKVMLHGRFLTQHNVAILEQCYNCSTQCRNNVARLCCANNRRCESSRLTSPVRSNDVRALVFSTLILIAQLSFPDHAKAKTNFIVRQTFLSRVVGSFRTSPSIFLFSAFANWRDRRKSNTGSKNAWCSRVVFLICCPHSATFSTVCRETICGLHWG